MTRPLSALAVCALVCSLAACGSARVVTRTPTGGTLALEGDHHKAMEEANRLIRDHCQGPYQILEDSEIVVAGQTEQPSTEWRIEYQCGALLAPAPAPAPGPPE